MQEPSTNVLAGASAPCPATIDTDPRAGPSPIPATEVEADAGTNPDSAPVAALATTRVERRRLRPDTIVELVLIVVAAALPLLWRWQTGSLRLPAGDAWAYERIVQVFNSTGVLRGVGWNDITLVGVLVPAIPWLKVFGFGRLQLATLTCGFAVLALLAVRSMLSTIAAPARSRLLALASVAFFAGVVGTSGTFLVDLYAFAGAAWALAFTVKLLAATSTPFVAADTERPTMHWVGRYGPEMGMVGASLFAFSVRQQTAAIPFALLAYLLRTNYPRRRLVALAAAFVVPAAIFYEWRSRLNGGGRIFYQLGLRAAAAGLFSMAIFLGVSVAPIAIATQRWRKISANSRLRAFTLALGAAMFMAALIPKTHNTVGHIRLISTIDGWDAVLRVPTFALICATAALGIGSVLQAIGAELWTSGLARRPWRTAAQPSLPSLPSLLAWVGTVAVVAEMAVVTLSAWYDPRYSLVSMTCFAGLLLHGPTVVWRRGVGVITLAFVTLASLVNLDHASVTVRAQFDAAAQLVCLGVPANHVDGGFIWNGLVLGQADPRGPNKHPDDGFPENIDIQWYPTMRRDAFVSLDRPEPSEGLAVQPAVVVHGLLPGTRVTAYGVARASAVTAPDGCRTAP